MSAASVDDIPALHMELFIKELDTIKNIKPISIMQRKKIQSIISLLREKDLVITRKDLVITRKLSHNYEKRSRYYEKRSRNYEIIHFGVLIIISSWCFRLLMYCKLHFLLFELNMNISTCFK